MLSQFEVSICHKQSLIYLLYMMYMMYMIALSFGYETLTEMDDITISDANTWHIASMPSIPQPESLKMKQ